MTLMHRAVQALSLIAIAWSLALLANHWGIPDGVVALWQFASLALGLGWILTREE